MRTCAPELVAEKKTARAAAYERFADAALAVAVAKVGALDAKAAIIASAVALDKALLLRGEPVLVAEVRTQERRLVLEERYSQIRPHVLPPAPAPGAEH